MHPRFSIPILSLCVLAVFAPFSGAAVIEVEGPQDSLAGPPSINHCTLRKAIINANEDIAGYPQCLAGSGLDTITIPAGMTITFALAGASDDVALTGDLDITDDLIIMGNGATVDGNDLDRIFQVHPGVTVTIYDLNIVNGNGNGGGGGITVVSSTLNLYNVTISGCNGPNGDGGAISADDVVLNMTNCTISGNTAAHHAGAIIINSGTAAITNSTITGNDTGFSNLCGGIRNTGTATLRNTIVAGNGPGNDMPNLDGAFTSLGYNIVGELGVNPGTPTIIAAIGDQLDVNDAAVSLGPLQNNGGPTPTHALLAGSIARDQGHSSGSSTDQRGLTRPCDDSSIVNATGGDGGDVGAYEEQVACSNAAPAAVDDSYNMNQDTVLSVAAPGVLANDSDPDGDVLTAVLCSGAAHGTVTLNSNGSFTYTPNAGFAGTDSFTYMANDGFGGSSCVTVTIQVADTQAPAITASTAIGLLWPPNHKLVDVGLTFSASDNSSAATTTVTVYSDEDDGATPDGVGLLSLRAERDGAGDGRFYLIVITATDAFSNTSRSCLTVLVPKSQSAADLASVQAQASAAQSQCTGSGLFVVGE